MFFADADKKCMQVLFFLGSLASRDACPPREFGEEEFGGVFR